MAVTSSFMFTNTSESSTKSVTLYNMGETTNYGKITVANTTKDSSGKNFPLTSTKLTNSTWDGGTASEVVEYYSTELGKVNLNSKIELQNPPKKQKADKFGVKYSTFQRTEDPANADFQTRDDAIFVGITITNTKSPYITDVARGLALERALSTLKREDGTWRFTELALGNTEPSRS